MAMFTSFTMMPKEVLTILCHHLLSTQDLFSFMRTSRSCHDAFQIRRVDILCAVIRNELSKESWHAVLGLLNVPRFEDGDSYLLPDGADHAKWDLKYDQFLQHHFEAGEWNMAATKDGEKKAKIVVFNWYKAFVRFSRDYRLFVYDMSSGNRPRTDTRYAQGSGTAQPPRMIAVMAPLAEAERDRLQRAFFRFELLCRLYAIPTSLYDLHNIGIEEHPYADYSHRHYLGRFDEPDREEIVTIGHYVHRRYERTLGDLQSELSCSLRSMAGKQHRGNVCNVNSALAELRNSIVCWEFHRRYLAEPLEEPSEEDELPLHLFKLGVIFLQYFLGCDLTTQQDFMTRFVRAECCFIENEGHCWPEYHDWVDDFGRRRPEMSCGSGQLASPVFRYVAAQKHAIYPLVEQEYYVPSETQPEYERRLEPVERLHCHCGPVPSKLNRKFDFRKLRDLGWVFWEDEERLDALGFDFPGNSGGPAMVHIPHPRRFSSPKYRPITPYLSQRMTGLDSRRQDTIRARWMVQRRTTSIWSETLRR